MSEPSDRVPKILASGREVVVEDVETLWSGLLAGSSTARQTAIRAQLLLETANATHVANWGLSSLHAITVRGDPATEEVSAAHERWRHQVSEYEADPGAWDRAYYRQIIIDFARRHGPERARTLGDKLVASGELREADVAAALTPDPDAG